MTQIFGPRSAYPVLSVVVIATVACLVPGVASFSVSRAPAADAAHLRSAYLLRHRSPSINSLNETDNAAARVQQLRRHFATVIVTLRATTEASIATALDRLQAASEEAWNEPTRAEWRQRLLRNRALQIERLVAYSRRGIFPLNEGHSSHAVPIFVDCHGTACAVGHLMQLSGWEEAVTHIASEANLIYVTHATQGPLADWILTSGLTHQEAALIQPVYAPTGEVTLGELIEPGAAIERRGVRFENVSFQVQNYEASDYRTWRPLPFCEHLPSGCVVPLPETDERPLPDPNLVHVLTGFGRLDEEEGHPFDWRPFFTPAGSHWLWVGAYPPIGAGINSTAYAPEGFAQYVKLRYDVVPLVEGATIDQVSVYSDPYQGGFPLLFQIGEEADAFWHTRVRNGSGLPLASVEIDAADLDDGVIRRTAHFAPQPRLTVESDVFLANDIRLTSVLIDFRVNGIPEPSTLALLIVAGAFILPRMWRIRLKP